MSKSGFLVCCTGMFPRSLLVLFLMVVTAAVLSLGCSKGTDSDVAGDEDDSTPPATIADVHLISVSTTTATLGWTAPGDDGSDGVAYEYDLRGSLDSITEANFSQGVRIDSVVVPVPAGLQQVCLLEGLTPGTSYFFAVKSRDEVGNWSGLSNCVRANCPANQIVSIPDVALDSIVREHLGLLSGVIYTSDVDTVTELWAEDAGISDLTGLEYFTAMGVIHLGMNDISDLTPLQGLVSLWGLGLGGNPITDLTPLSGLTNLVQIAVGQSPLSDVAPLAGLTKLDWIRLNDCDVIDFSPLYNLPLLRELDVNGNQLGDISFVTNFTHLRVVNLSSNQLSDITPLGGLTGLEKVYLTLNQIADLSSLTVMVNLAELDVRYNQVTDIEPLVSNSGLGAGDVLLLQNNPLSQESIDAHIPALQARGVSVMF